MSCASMQVESRAVGGGDTCRRAELRRGERRCGDVGVETRAGGRSRVVDGADMCRRAHRGQRHGYLGRRADTPEQEPRPQGHSASRDVVDADTSWRANITAGGRTCVGLVQARDASRTRPVGAAAAAEAKTVEAASTGHMEKPSSRVRRSDRPDESMEGCSPHAKSSRCEMQRRAWAFPDLQTPLESLLALSFVTSPPIVFLPRGQYPSALCSSLDAVPAPAEAASHKCRSIVLFQPTICAGGLDDERWQLRIAHTISTPVSPAHTGTYPHISSLPSECLAHVDGLSDGLDASLTSQTDRKFRRISGQGEGKVSLVSLLDAFTSLLHVSHPHCRLSHLPDASRGDAGKPK